jgi:hypothetical protein
VVPDGSCGRGLASGTTDANFHFSRPPAVTFGSSYSGSTPIPNRRPVPAAATGTSPTPQLFDFAKTDRRPSQSASAPRPARSSVIPASLPTRSILHSHKLRPPTPEDEDDMELDMAFDGDEDDYEEGARSGSAEVDMEDDEEGGGKEDWRKLALGTGSGGVKGRRKGMVFKCENCGKVGTLLERSPYSRVACADAGSRTGISPSELSRQASLGAQPALEGAHAAQHEQAPAGADARGESTCCGAPLGER